jgi:hypothetical protein
MKFQIKFDSAGKEIGAVDRAVRRHVKTIGCNPPCNKQCAACDEADVCSTQMLACADKFVQFGKQITIEFDTETGTATLVPV